ncbi:hypothetical protein CICLE_v10013233mg [Citrus x clementina]|uniref:Uncharacterized protein n=1 Tax=Citrus clementina TaxID=85681 RepID=V4SA42_CITCL|nr:hypothetical protein CICLE_v10013233mg [Citrus x clementina]GAY52723.1 hypothetical protein CUMW_144130 [Citrus unshiu]
MGRFCFYKLLLVSVLLLLSLPHGSTGFSRQLKESVEFEDSTVHVQEAGAEPREMMELMDYKDPGPNTNPKSGFMLSPPPQAH